MGGRSSSFKSTKTGASYVRLRNQARQAATKAFDNNENIHKKIGEIEVKRVSKNRILVKGRNGQISTVVPDWNMTKDNMETNPRFKKAAFINHYMSEEDINYLLPK